MTHMRHARNYLLRVGARPLPLRRRGTEVSQLRIQEYLDRIGREAASPMDSAPRATVGVIVPCHGHAPLFAALPEIALAGGTSIHFGTDSELDTRPRLRAEHAREGTDRIEIRQPSDVRRYRRYNDLNMTHSGSCFTKSAWQAAGGYYPDQRARLVPFSDRDFQIRLNALFPVALSPDAPFSFWRRGSSVDHGRNS